MRKFFYAVREYQTGNLLKGCITAENKNEVVLYLKRQQYIIISIDEYDFRGIIQNFKDRLAGNMLTDKDFILLCRQLSIMLRAGINIVDTFTIIKDNCNDKGQEQFLLRTIDGLQEGRQLSMIWQEKNKYVPEYLISALKVAEHTGMLAESLSSAADYLEQVHTERKKLQQICIYPLFLLMLLIVISSIMIFFVLPTFNDIFVRMNLQLPLLTRIVLGVGMGIKDNFLYIVFATLLWLSILTVGWKSERYRLLFYKGLNKLPVWGIFWEKIYLIQILRQLSFLLSSGISINESMKIIISGIHNVYLVKNLQKVYGGIKQGFSLTVSFRRIELRNNIFLAMLSVGEQTGMLVKSIDYCIIFLQRDVDVFRENFIKMLEPMLILAVGLIIGIFVAAVVLPLFEMVNTIGF